MNQVVGIFEATIYVFITDLVQFRKESSVLITGTFTLKLPFDSKLDLFENYIWVLIKVHAKSYFGLFTHRVKKKKIGSPHLARILTPNH